MNFNNMALQVIFYILLVFFLHSNFGSSHKIQPNTKFLKPLSGVQGGDNVKGLEQLEKNSTSFIMASHYDYMTGEPKWNKRKLTYSFTGSIIKKERRDTIQQVEYAIRDWAAATRPYFTFVRVSCKSVCPADIRISFERGNHGDRFPFGPPGRPNPGGLAHGFPAADGRLHFNGYERWSTRGAKDAYDVKTTALHELGHILGLGHSDVEEAVMYDELKPGVVKKLHADDIYGIRQLCDIK